jgi:hypothetical protein
LTKEIAFLSGVSTHEKGKRPKGARVMTSLPEKKSPTEPLDLQRKIEATLARKQPIESSYPYFPPDYEIPFLHIGAERQLFLDNFMLDHLEDVERIFPEPYRPKEPILKVGELPWEQHDNPVPTAAIYDPDDGKFKLWYIQPPVGGFGDAGRMLCYAESTDCLHWEKPLSNVCVPYEGYRETNIVRRDTTHVTVVLNHDQSDSSRKFLMLYNPHDRARAQGKHNMSAVAASPDGLRWTTISEDTPYRHHHESRIIWDNAIQKWVAYSQYSHHWNFLHRKRQIGRQESDDFIHWSPKEVVISVDWEPDLPPHLEFHEMSVRKIGELYIGIPGEFIADPLWCVRDGHNWRDHAPVRLGLYCSRDGKRWQRVGGPGPWVDNRQPGSIDAGYVCFTAAGQLLHGGKTHILYLACPAKQRTWIPPRPSQPALVPESVYEQGKREWESLVSGLGTYPRRCRSVGALILREDGWAELKPTYERGSVITRQFVFEGDTLQINADAYGGYVRAEALDPQFRPYEGFSAEECDPVYSDDPDQVWHTVSWQGSRDVRSLWNKPVRLVFHLHQASLYGFQFQEGQD